MSKEREKELNTQGMLFTKVLGNVQKQLILRHSHRVLPFFFPPTPLNDSVRGSNGPDLLICAWNNHSELRVVGGY